MQYKLKIDEPFLTAKLAGDKLFEIRCNDRGFQKGDTVIYTEHDLGKIIQHTFEITYVTSFMQQPNFVVFGEKYINTESFNNQPY